MHEAPEVVTLRSRSLICPKTPVASFPLHADPVGIISSDPLCTGSEEPSSVVHSFRRPSSVPHRAFWAVSGSEELSSDPYARIRAPKRALPTKPRSLCDPKTAQLSRSRRLSSSRLSWRFHEHSRDPKTSLVFTISPQLPASLPSFSHLASPNPKACCHEMKTQLQARKSSSANRSPMGFPSLRRIQT